jgi:hypothetical protein
VVTWCRVRGASAIGCAAWLTSAACNGDGSSEPPDTDPTATDTDSTDASTSSEASSTSSSSGDTSSSGDESSSSSTGDAQPQPGCDNGLVPGDFCFSVVADYGPFPGASSVASADFDDDGLVDLAVAASDDDAAHVLFNDGVGGLVDPMLLSTGGSPQVLVAADFNLDDDFDLVTSNNATANLSLLYGLSGAAFDPDVTYAVGEGPRAMVVGDIDGNRHPDILVAREGGAFALRQLMGDSDGLQLTFGPLVDENEEVLALALADIDGDAVLDLVATVGGSHEVVVLIGEGAGDFDEIARFSAEGEDPYALAVADLDADGDNDVLVGNREIESGMASMRVFDNAAGELQERGNYPQLGIGSIATGDLDADDDIDVVVSTLEGQSVVTLRNDGTGLLDEQDVFELGAGSEPLGVVITDLNADATNDFATADRTGWRVVVWLSSP